MPITDRALAVTWPTARDWRAAGNVLLSRTLVDGIPVWPITLDEAKLHCQQPVEADPEDTLFLSADGAHGLIPAATAYIESRSNLALINQTRVQYFDGQWNGGDPATRELELTMGPVVSVTSIKYLTTDYAEATVDPAIYRALTSSRPGRVRLKSGRTWPSMVSDESEAAWITYVAGHGPTAAAVPPELLQCVLVLIYYWFEHRDLFSQGKIDLDFSRALDRMIEGAGGLCRYV